MGEGERGGGGGERERFAASTCHRVKPGDGSLLPNSGALSDLLSDSPVCVGGWVGGCTCACMLCVCVCLCSVVCVCVSVFCGVCVYVCV